MTGLIPITDTGTLILPNMPMAPISNPQLPAGPDWGFQLKWDGVRMLSRIEHGRIRLYSRHMDDKTALYPEAVELLKRHAAQLPSLLLDGEAVMFDLAKQKPDFSQVLQRERTRSASANIRGAETSHFIYVLFDLLGYNGEDYRTRPFAERHEKLRELFPVKHPQLFVTDLFSDGPSLWQWVEESGWEGVVSKRLSSPYREGKQHKDWYKKKTAQIHEVRFVGLIIREGRVASLIMEKDKVLFGRVSLGLNESSKAALLAYGKQYERESPLWNKSYLPAELKREKIMWLSVPLTGTVTGLEVTAAGQLRHPKLVNIRV
ncbi:DNA ligase [Paenibacillus allorhizosphaerae]|uniref:Multifunctional non-homologous end joining DNA repair protein LigD n=1 Tax=Paenibacillus allorhizosphaerae TaxID=2849866 RepID=A0ABN7TVE5_9BACL|nr:DNA ligase [Paenibacillus allorhizosphaerae]CAG7653430.1 Multifunctional non-homologous end joining DNA repair protein LigD [Paenibacillus allorhizosphaerae]